MKHLKLAIANDNTGEQPPSWKTPLDTTNAQHLLLETQNQMAKGSYEIVNLLRVSLRETPLPDSLGASPTSRPQIKVFRDLIRKMFPTIQPEPDGKVYPLFLNVVKGRCFELPFGATFLNHKNMNAGIRLLHIFLEASVASPSDIALVTMYSAQAEAYQEVLKLCHSRSHEKGTIRFKSTSLKIRWGKALNLLSSISSELQMPMVTLDTCFRQDDY